MRLPGRLTSYSSIFQTFSREFKSKLAVGSSRISKLGYPIRAKPMESFLLLPGESVLIRESKCAVNPTLSAMSLSFATYGTNP
jgi:hypothetical protein